MNELERELVRRLNDSARPPRMDALDRAMGRIAETPQRSGWRVHLGAGPAPATWSRVGAFVAVAATALVVGIAIGQSGLPFGGRSPSPSAMADGSASPAPTSSAPAGWVEPQDYAFTFLSSCGERSLLGRFRVTVVDGVVASFEPLDEQAQRFPGGIVDIPTLARMMELAAEAEGRAGARVQVSFDPADGHPVEVEIDWDTDAMDDEECYLVSDYAPASAPTSAPAAFTDSECPDLPDAIGRSATCLDGAGGQDRHPTPSRRSPGVLETRSAHATGP